MTHPSELAAALEIEGLGEPPVGRGTYCNRSLNLRAIKAIGYDMDYTLIHYRVEDWERHAYEHLRRKLLDHGYPVANLVFDSKMMIRGLIIDTLEGNVVKANRFGYVKRAMHGTRRLDYDSLRKAYSQELIHPGNSDRYVFVDTLFGLSEACMYAQLVDLLDGGTLPEAIGYTDLYRIVRRSLDEAHAEGELKAGILANPERFVELDPLVPQTLLDQKLAGKRLLLITNSEWHYTKAIMHYAFDPYLEGMTWRDLFELVIVSARKPRFFGGQAPMFEVVDEERGLLQPVVGGGRMGGDAVNLGGNAALVEGYLGLRGAEILYVGDHVYADVYASKGIVRWRTALVVRELEREVQANAAFAEKQHELLARFEARTYIEQRLAQMRLVRLRKQTGHGPPIDLTQAAIDAEISRLKAEVAGIDAKITPLIQEAGQIHNANWGPLMRTVNDKSYFARQIERHADVYTSRVSNLGYQTPFLFIRSPRGSLPHDPGFGPRAGAGGEA